jgi:hypothetical protein
VPARDGREGGCRGEREGVAENRHGFCLEMGKWEMGDSSEGFRGLSEMFGLFGLQ